MTTLPARGLENKCVHQKFAIGKGLGHLEGGGLTNDWIEPSKISGYIA